MGGAAWQANTRRLAEELRRLRLSAGLTGKELGEAIDASQSKISKIENAQQSVRVDDVDAWARACGADHERREELRELAEEALIRASSWRRELRAGLRAKQLQVAELEQRATRIRKYIADVVPGLAQTPDYASAVLAFFTEPSSPEELAAGVAARMERQQILYDERTEIELLIGEAALYWRPEGSRSGLAAQLDRLIQLAVASPIRLGVVPLKAEGAPPQAEPFAIYDLPEEGRVVVIESLAAELRHDDPMDVATFERYFDLLAEAAVFGEEAQKLLAGHLERLQAEAE